MRFPATFVAVLLAGVAMGTAKLAGQEPEAAGWRSAPGAEVVLQSGHGPEDVSLTGPGLRVAIPVWGVVAVTAELGWWSVDAETGCPANLWEFRFGCEARGTHRIKLLGVAARLPVGERLDLTAGLAGGYWDEPATANLRSLAAGLRLRIHGGLHALFEVRSLRIFGDALEDRIDERMTYRTRAFGLEYRLPPI